MGRLYILLRGIAWPAGYLLAGHRMPPAAPPQKALHQVEVVVQAMRLLKRQIERGNKERSACSKENAAGMDSPGLGLESDFLSHCCSFRRSYVEIDTPAPVVIHFMPSNLS